MREPKQPDIAKWIFTATSVYISVTEYVFTERRLNILNKMVRTEHKRRFFRGYYLENKNMGITTWDANDRLIKTFVRERPWDLKVTIEPINR